MTAAKKTTDDALKKVSAKKPSASTDDAVKRSQEKAADAKITSRQAIKAAASKPKPNLPDTSDIKDHAPVKKSTSASKPSVSKTAADAKKAIKDSAAVDVGSEATTEKKKKKKKIRHTPKYDMAAALSRGEEIPGLTDKKPVVRKVPKVAPPAVKAPQAAVDDVPQQAQAAIKKSAPQAPAPKKKIYADDAQIPTHQILAQRKKQEALQQQQQALQRQQAQGQGQGQGQVQGQGQGGALGAVGKTGKGALDTAGNLGQQGILTIGDVGKGLPVAGKAVNGATRGAGQTLGAATNGLGQTLGNTTGALGRGDIGGTVGGATKGLGDTVGGVGKGLVSLFQLPLRPRLLTLTIPTGRYPRRQ